MMVMITKIKAMSLETLKSLPYKVESWHANHDGIKITGTKSDRCYRHWDSIWILPRCAYSDFVRKTELPIRQQVYRVRFWDFVFNSNETTPIEGLGIAC